MFNDLVIISVPLGRVIGMAECGKMFGLIGVINICSVQLVSKVGFFRRSTSTLRLLCSNGHENVSPGILCSQDNKLKSLMRKKFLKIFLIDYIISNLARMGPYLSLKSD